MRSVASPVRTVVTRIVRHRGHKGAWGRFFLGVCLLAWLNVAAQPCVMAMELAPDATIRAQGAHEPGGHPGHAADHEESSDCGHCPPLASHESGACLTGSASDCGVSPDYNIEKRSAKLKLKDLAEPLVLPDAPDFTTFVRTTHALASIDDGQLKSRRDPSLNIRYCVFLK